MPSFLSPLYQSHPGRLWEDKLPGSLKELDAGALDYGALAETAMRDACMEDNYFMPSKASSSLHSCSGIPSAFATFRNRSAMPGNVPLNSIYGALAETAMRDACMEDNYFMPSKEQVVEVYRMAYGGTSLYVK